MNELLIISADTLKTQIDLMLDNGLDFEDALLADIIYDITGDYLRIVGSGGYSTVFEHPHDSSKVIKISRSRRDADGWIQFMKFKNPESPWFPKAHVIDTSDWCTIAVIDKYTPVRDKVAEVEINLATRIVSAAEQIVCYDMSNTDENITAWLTRCVVGATPSMAEKYIAPVRDMLAVITYFKENNIVWFDDLGKRNMMMFGDQLIINDPIA